jgi:hypothetical protein
MRRLLLLLPILLLLTSGRLAAQHKSLEYFAKVPSRFIKPGLSPMQGVRFGFLGTPANQWLKNAGEMKLDLFRIPFSKRASLIISAAAWAGYKRQSRDLYRVRDEQAFERSNYFFAAPALSTGLSYGFFFPYYLNVRLGLYKPWEGAYYKANLPLQYSDQQGVQTAASTLQYNQQGFGKIEKYLALELYRPFKSHFPRQHPMGWSVAYTVFPGAESGSQGAWNFGLYWHIKAK